MNTFRTWFTPGSVAAAMLVALLWMHQLHLASATHEAIQIVVIGLTFLGLWALSRDRLPGD
jgi:hypothetical protein